MDVTETPARVICPLCEATCGLLVSRTGPEPGEGGWRITGNPDDVFSAGYLCPKGTALGALHEDPARLRAPLVRRDGELVEVSWEEAFAEIEQRLLPLIDEHGRDAVAVYFGNPTAHNLASSLYLRPLVKALGTRNVYSAGSVDQLPRVFAAGYLYGDPATVPIPDLDRTDYLLILGANPLVSNGSLMTAPDLRGRLRRIVRRGRVVVVDPRRTRTAEIASEHLAIRPGGDAYLLLGMVHTILDEGLEDLGTAAPHVAGLDELRALVAPHPPESLSARAGVDAADIRRLAREFAAADHAAAYGRMGTTTQAFGTLSSWLVDVLNTITGNLDAPGGVMFPRAAAGQPNTRPGPRSPFRHGRWHSRLRGYPEVMGELPAVTLPEEILTPGPGQIRALLTVAGNPALSVPGGRTWADAFEALDLMISLDPQLNETTRHADVILPGPSALERAHYDLLLNQYAVRNVARWSEAMLPSDLPAEWETLLRLAGIAAGAGAQVPVSDLDDAFAATLARLNGVEDTAGLTGPERALDLLLRAGPYELTFADVRDAPDGIDLGPLAPRLPDVLATASGRVELAPKEITGDLPRLLARPDPAPDDPLLLVGRRHLRSNNSWMHHVPALLGGTNRCTLQIGPDDAARHAVIDGGRARVTSAVGHLEVEVEVTQVQSAGTVSLPHGWEVDHGADGRGANSNVLSDPTQVDVPTGTAVVNGIPVSLTPL